ncbi:hypothetical protein GS534_00615 [Rhodococcus hoagii]|nr:hypothetical protein [Prescottella equi]
MTRMLGKSSFRPYVFGDNTGRTKKCFGCLMGCGYDASNKTQRQREKRVTQKWLDEYEARSDGVGVCPRGGLGCTCNKLPDECSHLDWDDWDNDFGGYAIAELFPVEPKWTLDSLQTNRTALKWNGPIAL